MRTKDKAKCPYFYSLYGLPSRFGIECWLPEEEIYKELNFSKANKFERDIHFEKFCCNSTFYMCENYPIKYPNGWLNPLGEFYQIPYCQHCIYAMQLEENLKLTPQFNDLNSIVHGEELLEILGWIKIYSSPFGNEGHIFMSGRAGRPKPITEKQIRYLESIKDKMIGEQPQNFKNLIKRVNI